MNLAENTICKFIADKAFFTRIIKLTPLLALLLIYSPASHAADCQPSDADCLNKLVIELKNDMKTLIARVKADKAAADKLNKENSATQEQLKKLIANKDQIISKQKEIIKAQEKDRELADKQVSKLKLCCLGNPNNLPLRFNLGIGATSNKSDVEAAGLIGIGIGRINIHGFLQSDNSGLILGYQF